MVYQVSYEKEALKELGALESSISKRIIKKIDEMSENPSSCDIKKLKGNDYFRLRIGDYRVIFIFENMLIKILKVGHRKNIYDR
ncbi:MAG: type II toxin-antitoxin system RelE/ParE family toxin [Nanoarchaeota archaeon]